MSESVARGPRQELAAALRQDRRELVNAIVERIRSDVHEYRDVVAPEIIAQLGKNVEGHLNVYIDLLEFDGPGLLGEERFAFAHEAARIRAHQGVSAESMIRSFSSATSRLWDWLIDRPFSVDREAIMRYGWPVWFEYINDAAARVGTVYHQIELEKFEDDLAARSALLNNLIDMRLTGVEARRALVGFGIERSSGLELAILRVVRRDTHNIEKLMRRVTRDLAGKLESLTGVRPLTTVRDDDLVFLIDPGSLDVNRLRATMERVAASASKANAVSGVLSRPLTQTGEIGPTYGSCYHALRVLDSQPRIALSTEISVLDYATAALGADIRLACPTQMAQFLRGATVDHPDWLETIEAWAAYNMNAKQTANAMHVHVNTIYYRLERLAQATGIDPYSVTDVVGLVIANRLRGHLVSQGDVLDDSTKGP
jgi:hypothetical protein